MDNRKAKRPRSTTPTKAGGLGGEESVSPKKKSKSSKKKSKRQRANSESELKNKHHTGLDSTATADGQMMAQMVSTFSKLEQSRFEAFRRSTVPANAIQEWLAACLTDRYRIHDNNNKNIRTLSDLVQPGQADSISMVVATLAKVYAQRLVSAARVAAQQQDAAKQTAAVAATNNNNTNTNSVSSSSEAPAISGADSASYNEQPQQQQYQSPLEPRHVWQALRERQTQGMDPGFFLQENEGLQWNSTVHSTHDRRRLAALQAQEEYDAFMKSEQEKEESTASQKDSDNMDVYVTT